MDLDDIVLKKSKLISPRPDCDNLVLEFIRILIIAPMHGDATMIKIAGQN
jgi:hypothetical protein